MKPLDGWELGRGTLLRIGMLVAVMTVQAACSKPDANSGGSTGASPATQAGATATPKADPAKKPTPTLQDAGLPDDPGKLTEDQRKAYRAKLTFDNGSAGDDAECPSDSCKPGDPRARVRIEPETGSHLLSEAHFQKGWRVVAKITLIDPSKPHKKWKLEKVGQEALWWVGPNANGVLTTMLTTGADTVVYPHSFCIRKDAVQGTAMARWKKQHNGEGCLKVAADSAVMHGLTASQRETIRTFHETWFACAMGCCSALE